MIVNVSNIAWGVSFGGSCYKLKIWYPTELAPNHSKSFFYWRQRIENCTITHHFSTTQYIDYKYEISNKYSAVKTAKERIKNESRKNITILIDDYYTTVKLVKRINELYPSSIIEINKV